MPDNQTTAYGGFYINVGNLEMKTIPGGDDASDSDGNVGGTRKGTKVECPLLYLVYGATSLPCRRVRITFPPEIFWYWECPFRNAIFNAVYVGFQRPLDSESEEDSDDDEDEDEDSSSTDMEDNAGQTNASDSEESVEDGEEAKPANGPANGQVAKVSSF